MWFRKVVSWFGVPYQGFLIWGTILISSGHRMVVFFRISLIEFNSQSFLYNTSTKYKLIQDWNFQILNGCAVKKIVNSNNTTVFRWWGIIQRADDFLIFIFVLCQEIQTKSWLPLIVKPKHIVAYLQYCQNTLVSQIRKLSSHLATLPYHKLSNSECYHNHNKKCSWNIWKRFLTAHFLISDITGAQ